MCSTCQGFTVSLSKTGNLREEEKELMLQKYGDHIQKAKKQSWDLPMAWANKNVFLHIW
jgi:hypothetical protein